MIGYRDTFSQVFIDQRDRVYYITEYEIGHIRWDL